MANGHAQDFSQQAQAASEDQRGYKTIMDPSSLDVLLAHQHSKLEVVCNSLYQMQQPLIEQNPELADLIWGNVLIMRECLEKIDGISKTLLDCSIEELVN